MILENLIIILNYYFKFNKNYNLKIENIIYIMNINQKIVQIILFNKFNQFNQLINLIK